MMHFELGDRLRLRKQHPCGNFDWEVVRLGADIGCAVKNVVAVSSSTFRS